MKKAILAVLLIAAVLALTACGGQKDAATEAPVATAAPEVTDPPEVTAPPEKEAAAAPAVQTVKASSKGVDLDLSKLSGTVVYSQVYDMMVDPDSYLGQRVRVKGNFNYYHNDDNGQDYFAVIIADATACCAQGMEFVWAGDHNFPMDYPLPDSEITVTGTFGTYMEDGFEYIQLSDADLKWETV